MPTISWEGCFVPEPPAWLGEAPVRLLSTGERAGPGAARNLAARRARGEVLLFVDADVELHPGAVQRFRAHFQQDPSLSAVFGSYDDSPAAPGIVSRYRNLLHHHVHQCHPGPAVSFWAGCGAVRRERFLAEGGFDPRYDRPSIEDIEFGRRLSAAGGRILLDPAVQGTHHKRWTLASMLMTDIGRRAIPWSRLLLARRDAALPPTLNLEPSARWSGGAAAHGRGSGAAGARCCRAGGGLAVPGSGRPAAAAARRSRCPRGDGGAGSLALLSPQLRQHHAGAGPAGPVPAQPSAAGPGNDRPHDQPGPVAVAAHPRAGGTPVADAGPIAGVAGGRAGPGLQTRP
ncbi:glycosyltransferase [Cyanobium sp. FGCU-52]|nr:glycosyltransferase [Cyanobium sp. FGCU52]